MKKLLSMLLALTLVMSLFCAVPVSAADVTYGEYSFPYLYENFENNTTLFASNSSNTPNEATVVDSGLANRGKVAQVKVTGKTNGGAGLRNSTTSLSTTLEIGDKITVSMWIKSSVKLKSANFSIICFPDRENNFSGTLNGNGYHSFIVPFDKNSTDWQYVTQTFTSSFTGNTKSLEYRFGTTGGLNFAADETTTGETDRVYLVDDFEIIVEKQGGSPAKDFPYEENIALADNESWSGLNFTTIPANDVQSVVTGTTADPAPSGEKFMRVVHKQSGQLWLHINLKNNLKAGHSYKFTFKSRVQGLPMDDGTLNPAGPTGATAYNYINYQIRYPINNKTATWGANSSAIGGAYSNNMPYTDARYNNKIANTNPLGLSEWYTNSIIISSDKLNIEENLSSGAYLEMGIWLYNQDGRGLGTYDFDDFQVIDYGPMTAGGFDVSWNTAQIQNGNRVNDDKRSGLMSGWIMDSGVKSWGTKTGSSAYTRVGDDARIPSERNNANAKGLLYGQYTSSAEFYQYVPTYAGGVYEFKGYVRGATPSGGSRTQGRARLVVDYSGETLAEEVYNVKALGTDGVIYGDWVEFTGEDYDELKPLSVRVDLTNLALIEGKTETLDIMPRTPKVYVDFDEEWSGNVNAPNTTDHCVYMDAFTVKKEKTGVLPEVSDPIALGEAKAGTEITLRYTANSDLLNDGDNSIIKLCTKAGSNTVVLAVFNEGDNFIVPSNVQADDALFIEIIPYTDTMIKGETVTVSVLPKFDIDFTISPFSEGNATAKVMLTSNDPQAATTNAVLVVCTYDANGALIKAEFKPVVCEGGSSSDGDSATAGYQHTIVTATAVPGKAAAKAKAFLWDCGTETSPTVFNTTMVELSPTLEVSAN